jgi:hypothetical protein
MNKYISPTQGADYCVMRHRANFHSRWATVIEELFAPPSDHINFWVFSKMVELEREAIWRADIITIHPH